CRTIVCAASRLRYAGAGVCEERMIEACGAKGVCAGQALSMAARVIRKSPGRGVGSEVSLIWVAAIGTMEISSAGSNTVGTTRAASSGSRVRCPADSVWVPLQCGITESTSQLQLAPLATEPEKPGAR